MLRDIPLKTTFKTRAARQGLSILEVMVSIGILVLGLLGVIALIPIAAQKLRQGIALDDATAVARAGAADIQAREGNNIRKWLRYQPTTFATPAAGTMNNLWGVQMALDPYPVGDNTPSAFVNPSWAFCIDPMMYESALVQSATNRRPEFFPYQPQTPAGGAFPGTAEIRTGLPSTNFGRMVRVTMNWNQVDWRQLAGSPQLTPAVLNVGLASSMCVSPDDLLLTSPGQEPAEGMLGATVNQTDASASQYDVSMNSWDTPAVTRIKRNNEGRLSWFATLVPLPGSMTSGVRYYTMSVAVVERRDMILDNTRETTLDSTEEQNQSVESERTMGVRFVGGGLGGGEVQLVSYQATPALGLKNLSRLREGNWIMISGPSGGAMGHIYYWYRIGSIDPEPSIAGAEVVRTATLRGPDWPSIPTYASGMYEATVVSNVINVYEQTIELRGE